MYQMMLQPYWDIHYNVLSDDALEELKNLAPTMEEWEMMTETEAVLRSTQLLSMSLQTNTPAPVAVSLILVCSAWLKLPSEGYDIVQDIVGISPHNQPWNGIMALPRDLPKSSKNLCDCEETTQMVAARLSKEYYQYFMPREGVTSWQCSATPSWHTMVFT